MKLRTSSVEILWKDDPVPWDRMEGGDLAYDHPSPENNWTGRTYRRPTYIFRGLGPLYWRETRRVRFEDLTLTYQEG